MYKYTVHVYLSDAQQRRLERITEDFSKFCGLEDLSCQGMLCSMFDSTFLLDEMFDLYENKLEKGENAHD